MKEFDPNKFEPNTSYENRFAWAGVIDCLNHRFDSSKFYYHESCPMCQMTSENLIWIKFKSSPSTWKNRCGRQGPLSICPSCNIQVEFICEVMN